MVRDELGTAVVHAGEEPGAFLGALSVPVYRAAVLAFPSAEQGAAIREGPYPARLGEQQ